MGFLSFAYGITQVHKKRMMIFNYFICFIAAKHPYKTNLKWEPKSIMRK